MDEGPKVKSRGMVLQMGQRAGQSRSVERLVIKELSAVVTSTGGCPTNAAIRVRFSFIL